MSSKAGATSATTSSSTTAPTINKQIVRGGILISILLGSTWLSKSGSQHSIVLLHLVAFSSWFGCSVWVSFVAGLVMFNNLPRHVFGRLQSKLFPAYFQFSTLCIVISILTTTTQDSKLLLYLILGAILANLLYLEPQTTKVMYQRHAVEKRLGTGHEVGQLRPDDPVKANDPSLKELSKKFGMLHGISSLSNLIALGIGCVWYSYICGTIVVGMTTTE